MKNESVWAYRLKLAYIAAKNFQTDTTSAERWAARIGLLKSYTTDEVMHPDEQSAFFDELAQLEKQLPSVSGAGFMAVQRQLKRLEDRVYPVIRREAIRTFDGTMQEHPELLPRDIARSLATDEIQNYRGCYPEASERRVIQHLNMSSPRFEALMSHAQQLEQGGGWTTDLSWKPSLFPGVL